MSSSGGPDNIATLSPKKKCCLSLGVPGSESAPRRSLFPALPLELLAEILIQTNSPRDVLAVARTSRVFCSTLACNPAADFIWRTVRKRCLPSALPDPTPNFSEAGYAALVYDGGLCEMCGKHTNEFYVSFAARIRLCRDSSCRKDFVAERLIDVTSMFKGRARDAIWIPYVESTRCFAPMSNISIAWPENPTVLMRKSEWKRFGANQTELSLTSAEELRKACINQIAKFPKVMELAVALQKWKFSYAGMYRSVKNSNEAWAKTLAHQEGWNVHDLLNCQSYGSLHRCKTSILEEVILSDFLAIKPLIEVQLLKMQEHCQNRQNEASYRQRRTDVEQYYNRLRSAGTVVPSLSEFRKLPVMKAVQGSVTSPSPNGLALDLKKSGLAAELVTADLKKWMEPVRERLSALLGFPRWKSASKTKLHPLHRLTARFRCQRCGKVSKRYETEGCLDFLGVCAHECPNHEKKDQRSVNWNIDWFGKDEKASNAITRVLTLAGVTDEDPTAYETLKGLGVRIRCLSCEHAFIVMDFPTIIGHSHRHDDMQVAIVPEGEFAFDPGLSAKLLDTSFRAKKGKNEAIYRCRHCIPPGESDMDEEGQVSTDPAENVSQKGDKKKRQRNKKRKFRPMDFNALRSHLKGKHGIKMVRDEDFFAQRPVSGWD